MQVTYRVWVNPRAAWIESQALPCITVNCMRYPHPHEYGDIDVAKAEMRIMRLRGATIMNVETTTVQSPIEFLADR